MSSNLQNVALSSAIPAPQNRYSRASNTREFAKPLAALVAISVFLIFLTLMTFRVSAQPTTRLDSSVSGPLLFEPYSAPGSPIRYLAHAARYTVFLSNDEADIILQQEKAPSQKLQRGGLIVVQAHASLLRMRFLDADPPTSVNPTDSQNLPGSPLTAVAYRGLYPGTDIILRGDQHGLQFQVNLSPGASAENPVIEFAGATGLSLRADGTAVVHAGRASLLLERPLILRHRHFYKPQAPQSSVGAFQIEKRNRLRFIMESPAPASHPQDA